MMSRFLAAKFRSFCRDARGNYALATVAVMVPLLGALALAVDFSQMSRERQLTLNALDAAGIATARRLIEGASPAELEAYAHNFFNANLGRMDPNRVSLSLVLPNDNTAGGGTLKVSATLDYQSLFFGAFQRLRGESKEDLSFSATSEVKLKNTVEVALVLDNSGSMDYTGTGSGKKRMVLLKEAAKQLVDTLSAQSAQMKQLQNPVQFGLVPFAGSVNVGATNANAPWMDTSGISPVHHENFEWGSFGTAASSPKKYVENLGGVRYARGEDWGDLKDTALTRFTLFNNVKRITGTTPVTKTVTRVETYCKRWFIFCLETGTRTVTETVTTYIDVYENPFSWKGCVEARPYPYNITDETVSTGTPATLFVPMFAPDEAGNFWTLDGSGTSAVVKKFSSHNSWWDDAETGTPTTAAAFLTRQRKMQKYFVPAPLSTSINVAGPNEGCTTSAILPLTDVSTSTGVNKVKAAIDAMAADGATNVPEGMAWGWRVLSSKAPFTEGRPETEKGNDKVVIVLTDGANTYYTPGSLGYRDNADLKSTYSNLGYANVQYNGTTTPRIFMGTSGSVSKSTFDNTNYTKAMNEHFATLCTNAKQAGITVMTVALDLSSRDATEKAQIDALSACASESKFRRTSSGAAAKLFWNATGSSLADDFKSIADELSNLRIVS